MYENPQLWEKTVCPLPPHIWVASEVADTILSLPVVRVQSSPEDLNFWKQMPVGPLQNLQNQTALSTELC